MGGWGYLFSRYNNIGDRPRMYTNIIIISAFQITKNNFFLARDIHVIGREEFYKPSLVKRCVVSVKAKKRPEFCVAMEINNH